MVSTPRLKLETGATRQKRCKSGSPALRPSCLASFSGTAFLRTRPDELRTNLRHAFDAFDTSGSGLVPVSAIESIIAAVDMTISPEDLVQLVADVDVEGRGKVVFEELFRRIKFELRRNRDRERDPTHTDDGEGLRSLVWHTSSFLNWINPLRWFEGLDQSTRKDQMQEETTPTDSPTDGIAFYSAKEQTSARQSITRRSTVCHSTCQSARMSVRSQRSVLSEWLIKERNAQMAEEQRKLTSAMEQMRQERHKDFMQRQQQKRAEFHQHRVDLIDAAEALKAVKREMGVEMRLKLQAAYHKVQEEKRQRAKLVSAKTVEVRQIKAAETTARRIKAAETANMIAAKAAAERAARRDETLKTVRDTDKAKRDYTARVRYETRPAVRRESREIFQAQRNATYAAEVRQKEKNRSKRQEQHERFLDRALETVLDVKDDMVKALEARYALEDKRRQVTSNG